MPKVKTKEDEKQTSVSTPEWYLHFEDYCKKIWFENGKFYSLKIYDNELNRSNKQF